MKTSGTCPKSQSTDIIHIPDDPKIIFIPHQSRCLKRYR